MLATLLLCSALLQDPAAAAAPSGEIAPQDWLVLDAVDARGRRPFRPDAVFRRHLLDPSSPPPVAGAEVSGSTGSASWRTAAPAESGFLSGIGWGYTAVESAAARVMMAELTGATTLFVNGAGFVGDHYRFGHRGVPVALRVGVNHLYVTGVRGGFRLRLWQPEHKLQYAGWTTRQPDLVAGEPVGGEASIALMNASTERVPLLYVVAGGVGPFARKRSLVTYGLEPLHLARVPVALAPRAGHELPAEPATQKLYLSVGGSLEEDPHVHWLDLEMRRPQEARRRTYRSRVDGAVVEFSILAPAGDGLAAEDGRADGLVLSLHGAGVGSRGQAASYAPKPGFWLVAPSNRAPFGFDWQDWGRIDAQQVLALMMAEQRLDPRRVMVTGHSMGGHGAWSLAVNDPDAFAAVAPSAGWCSFDSYVPRPAGALRELWHAADGTSDTLDLLSNLKGKPVYVLHGDADDNVPPSEAAIMVKAMDERGIDYTLHLEPGAGHWWTDDRYPGAECMDWPPIFAMFAEARLPERPLELDFVSVDPIVDAEHFWLRVDQVTEYGRKLGVRARYEPDPGLVVVETSNVRRLWVGVEHALIRLDRQDIAVDPAAPGHAYLREDGHWRAVGGGIQADEKGPHRSGPFRRAFDNDFVLVYGTAGTPAENRESLERARFDAQRWFYRAFGNARLAADAELLDPEHPEDFSGRNLILYGNADTNRAWPQVLPEDCPLQVGRGEIRLGDQRWTGDDKAALFCFPRRDDPYTLVGAFADTGVPGARLGYTLSPFLAGVGVPDYAIYGVEVLASGDDGVLAAGWWDRRWGRGEASED